MAEQADAETRMLAITPENLPEELRGVVRLHLGVGLAATLATPIANAGSFSVVWGALFLVSLALLPWIAMRGVRLQYRRALRLVTHVPLGVFGLVGLSALFDEWHWRGLATALATAGVAALPAADLWLMLGRPPATELSRGIRHRERSAHLWARRCVKAQLAAALVTAALILAALNDPRDEFAIAALAMLGLVGLLGVTLAAIGGRSELRLPLLPLLAFASVGLPFVLDRMESVSIDRDDARALFLVAPLSIACVDLLLLVLSPSRRSTMALRTGADVADLIRDRLMCHGPYRVRGAALRLLMAAIWLPGGFLVPGLGAWAIVRSLPTWDISGTGGLLIALPLMIVWVGIAGALTELLEGRQGAKLARGQAAEEALIRRLESGRPFGLYLRPFRNADSSKPPSGVDHALARASRSVFFAIRDTQMVAEPLRIPEIWVPGRDWESIVFSLIHHAGVVVFDLSDAELGGRAGPGLVKELAYTVGHRLAHKGIVIRPDSKLGVRAWGRDLDALCASFPHVLKVRELAAYHGPSWLDRMLDSIHDARHAEPR